VARGRQQNVTDHLWSLEDLVERTVKIDMCGPWLILAPLAGLFIAVVIYQSEWRRPRKTEGAGWTHLGLLLGFVAMFSWMYAFCRPI
jgi:hypothetical protein